MSRPEIPSTYSLSAGEGRSLRLPRGARLICLEGSLSLAYPLQSMAGRVFAPGMTLRAGEQQCVDEEVSLGLQAGGSGARLLCLLPAPAPSLRFILMRVWRRWLASLEPASRA